MRGTFGNIHGPAGSVNFQLMNKRVDSDADYPMRHGLTRAKLSDGETARISEKLKTVILPTS